ncbi:hypothetical protein G3580_00260 [Nitrogeniibacter mangrovi]|uniref:Lipoprotein n=1 Tax=Nitrogeniibacter mangrovi TaxID=2016596 RepID=A0A6C1AYJ5_9RHOO|nr:hypothetical protein [Nitrogeniibacter mangrovi]QID16193.1 hypothetical protein G3580_00260 [Nitrogeniibacter mangrovi]
MAMKTPLIALAAIGLTACATAAGRLDTAGLSELYIADFTSTDPTGCTTADVDLSNDDAQAFFHRARQLSEKALADNYPLAPCRIEGTLKYDNMPCDFEISAAMTGVIRCERQRWHFACDDCEALFGR